MELNDLFLRLRDIMLEEEVGMLVDLVGL